MKKIAAVYLHSN